MNFAIFLLVLPFCGLTLAQTSNDAIVVENITERQLCNPDMCEILKEWGAVTERIRAMETRLKESETRLKVSETRLTDSEIRLKDSETQILELKNKDFAMTENMRAMEIRLNESESRLKESETRLTESETRLKESETRLTDSEIRLTASEIRLKISETRLKISETRLTESETRLMISETRLTESESRLKISETRLNESETRLTESESQILELRNKERPKVVFSAGIGGRSRTIGPFTMDKTLIYQRVITNIGRAYSTSSGIFTAPIAGVYYFTFSYHAGGQHVVSLRLYKNNQLLVASYDYKTSHDGTDNGGNAVFVQLQRGDQVFVRLGAKAHVWGSDAHTTFSGCLVAK